MIMATGKKADDNDKYRQIGDDLNTVNDKKLKL